MRSWLFASGLVTWLALAGAAQSNPAQTLVSSHPANELMLAGLRPGRDTLARADSLYKSKHRVLSSGSHSSPVWVDSCAHRSLSLESDEKGTVQSVTLSSLSLEAVMGDCSKKAYNPAARELWKTGRGLKLGDPRDRIIEMYGEPNSSGPSTKNGRELELLFYAFDWAGSEVPQVLEVSCDRATGRVVEITLAYPSL
jgi:hypothetical protein